MILFISACATQSGVTFAPLSNRPLDVIEVDGVYFNVDQASKDSIQKCISSNEEVKSILINYNKEHFGKEQKEDNPGAVKRRVIKRGNFMKGLPKEHITTLSYYEVFYCANQEGQVVLSKPISTNQSFEEAELEKFSSALHDYELEKNVNDSCLRCGKIYIKINENNDKLYFHSSY